MGKDWMESLVSTAASRIGISGADLVAIPKVSRADFFIPPTSPVALPNTAYRDVEKYLMIRGSSLGSGDSRANALLLGGLEESQLPCQLVTLPTSRIPLGLGPLQVLLDRLGLCLLLLERHVGLVALPGNVERLQDPLLGKEQAREGCIDGRLLVLHDSVVVAEELVDVVLALLLAALELVQRDVGDDPGEGEACARQMVQESKRINQAYRALEVARLSSHR